ncbi:MAG: HEAT repeat domain-containing protein [Planctomycetota bacterium]
MAAIAATEFGPGIESLASILVSQVKVETESGVRLFLALALSRVGPRDAGVASCLEVLLGDAEEVVRSAAATVLGELVNPPGSVVERLRHSVTDPTEADGVRKLAAKSLTKLTTSSNNALPTLTVLLEVRGLIKDSELSWWLDAVGKIAAFVPASEDGTQARRLLESTAGGEDPYLAHAAMSGLARIAFATRDVDLGWQAATEFRRLLPRILLTTGESDGSWHMDSEWAEPVMEALVVLSRWPEMGVRADELRAVFYALQSHELASTRDWADGQMALLR